ncbi:MAG: type II toxin-antitoxin system HigB family toxin [Candidatus Riflebacteria bacterium]|nr:type II toxin-antitoxin system HigB family toxin [Candidatus Riflebacteria bacterium]
MHVISQKKLRDFWSLRSDAGFDLRRWYLFAKKAHWRDPSDIKAVFSSASFLKNNRVIFHVSGNKYRLVVKMVYESQRAYIRFIGTHQEYDRIDPETI